MSDSRYRALEELFQRAADLPPELRTGYLDAHCGDDPELRAEVESLLTHLDGDSVPSLRTVEAADTTDADLVGMPIGPYRLLELIGEGGFGSVFRAEQERPIQRQVALKIIKLGMDTRQVIARFEAERQALAMMDHPNIARVHDAGATDAGRPYFVMELVDGIPATDFCDRHRFTTQQRLELFVQVCRGVQHAHQKGIIHRDIKPSNVMVINTDAPPTPKIIDFGIAKAMGQRLTDKTLFTELMQFLGTPQYMSPEQAEMSGLDVDTRSDIYSLGVLLYELLTGTTPFDPEHLQTTACSDIQRIIREQDPPTPSRRLSTLGGRLSEVATLRQADARALTRSLRGDLDWIVMKALEKDRTRRYESAGAFAEDVLHYLRREPVLAGPPGMGYRLSKFVRRNRLGVVAGGLVAAAILIGLTLATVGFVNAGRERDRALAAEQRAEAEARHARQEAEAAVAINEFFTGMLASVDPTQQRLLSALAPEGEERPTAPVGWARDESVAEMMRRASANITEAFAGKPELEARARETIGMALWGLGLYPESMPQLEAALDIRRRALGDDHPDTLRSSLALGDFFFDAGRSYESAPLIRAALAGMRRVYGDEHPRTLDCASTLAFILFYVGAPDEGDRLFQDTLDRQRRVLGAEHRDTLSTMLHWSSCLLSRGRLVPGAQLAEEVYETSHRVLNPQDIIAVRAETVSGQWHILQGRNRQAEAVLRSGLAKCRRLLGDEHPLTCSTMTDLAGVLEGEDGQQEKGLLLREALAGMSASAGESHYSTLPIMRHLGLHLHLTGKMAEAEGIFRKYVEGARVMGGEASPSHREALAALADSLEDAGRFGEAVAVLTERLGFIRDANGVEGEETLRAMTKLAARLVQMGRADEARRITEPLIDRRRRRAKQPEATALDLGRYAHLLLTCHPVDLRNPQNVLAVAERAVELSEEESAFLLDTLALACQLTGDARQALEFQAKAVACFPLTHPQRLNYLASQIDFLLRGGDVQTAEQLGREAVATLRERYAASQTELARQLQRAGRFLAWAGLFALAESVHEEVLAIDLQCRPESTPGLARDWRLLAEAQRGRGRHRHAARSYREMLKLRRTFYGERHLQVARGLVNLGSALRQSGDRSGAERALREAVETYHALAVEDIPDALAARLQLARLLIELGNHDEAKLLTEDALNKIRGLYGDEHLNTADALATHGLLLTDTGRAQEAEPVLRRALALAERLTPPDEADVTVARAKSVLGYCLTKLGGHEEAEALLKAGYRDFVHECGDISLDVYRVVTHLVALYEAWGKQGELQAWRAQLPTLDDTPPE